MLGRKPDGVDIVSIICAKREGRELSRHEIELAVSGFTAGDIPDYQMSSLLMAICVRGMTVREAVDLTRAMVATGATLDLSAISGPKLDKHSTGGVGDKTTLVVAPIVSAAGITVAKLSGRGLGHTGGTLDKLEAIPGLRTDLGMDELVDQAKRIGLAIAGHSADLVPADKKIYALRDVTGTVASIPLITSSIISKKIAGGADGVVFDVKAGSGAFMKSVDEARELATCLVEVARGEGLAAAAIVSDMDQPLGRAVGNGLEVAEAIDVLGGDGPADVRELSITLAARMLVAAGQGNVDDPVRRAREPGVLDEAVRRATELLDGGAAREKFSEMIEAQGGDGRVALEPDGFLPRAAHVCDVPAQSDGYVTSIDAELVGKSSVLLGAGRMRYGDAVDAAAGILLARKAGDGVLAGEPLATLHTSADERLEDAVALLEAAFVIEREPRAARPLIIDTVD